MTKKKKLAKFALSHPQLFSEGELAYMQMWLNERKRLKSLKKEVTSKDPEEQKTPWSWSVYPSNPPL